MNEVTRILHAIQEGQTEAAAELFRLVYEELRRLAAAKMVQENAGLTLQPTALVHEAWLRLAEGGNAPELSLRNFFIFPWPFGSEIAHDLLEANRSNIMKTYFKSNLAPDGAALWRELAQRTTSSAGETVSQLAGQGIAR